MRIKKSFNTNKKLYLATLFSLSFLSGGYVNGDSTFFPEDKTAEKPQQETSDAIKEWVELKPTPQEKTKAIPQKQPEATEASLTQTEATSSPPVTDAQEQKSAETLAPLPESNTILTEAPETSSTIEEKKPLEITKVTARPKPVPVQEEPQAATNGKGQGTLAGKVVSYSDAANDRPPLGILSPKQEVHNQRWYIYSSAIRGLKNPSDVVQIVSMAGAPAQKGEEIKNLLIEMGIEADKIQLINARGEEDQAGVVYIFAGK